MPRNPSGEYSLPYNWNDDKADGIKILASKMQTQEQDIADALTGSLPVNGSAPMQADLDMNNNNIVDVSDGVNLQDAMTVKQGQSGSLQYFGVSSTIPAGTDGEDYEIATAPIIITYPAFLRFSFVCHFTCVDSPNMRLNTLATKNFFKEDGAGGYIALQAGDMVADAQYECIYNEDISTSNIIVTNPETISGSIFDNLTANDITINKTIKGSVFNRKLPLISNNATDANNDIDFKAGGSFDTTNNVGWASTAITKRLDIVWAAGTNQGGLDTGSKASNTFYYCYTIYNPATNINDAIFSTNASSPTLPTGYTRYCYVGAILTDGSSNILSFYQVGNNFYFGTTIINSTPSLGTGDSGVFATYTLSVPRKTGILAKIYIGSEYTSTSTVDLAVKWRVTGSSGSINIDRPSMTDFAGYYGQNEVITNGNGEVDISFVIPAGSSSWVIATNGWIDTNL